MSSREPRSWLIAKALVGWLLACVADLLGPPACVACDGPRSRARVFCGACEASVIAARDFPRRAPFLFGGSLRDAIHRLKYGRRSDLARPLGELMGAYAVRARLTAHIVVPVPLHPVRLVERGFNQSGLLARPVARALGVPLDTSALRRVAHKPPQAGLDREARLANMRSCFAVARPDRVRGRTVLVVDDVYTTGATFEACRTALLDAGAADVRCLALARTS